MISLGIPDAGFPLSIKMSDCVLGRNTRMLACHSRDRTQAGFHLDKDLKSTMAVYYRALLKDLCTKFYPTVLDRDGRDLRVGKIYSKIEKSNTPFIGIVCLYRFKGSSDQTHFIFEINVGKSRIRRFQTLISKI